MHSVMRLFGTSVDAKIPKWLAVVLSVLLFFVIVSGYFTISHFRHVENPDDKIVPSNMQLAADGKLK